MKIQPTYAQVEKIAATGCYNVLPVSLEILSDFTTPIETMKILKNVSTHCYMLESAQANETWGRYTFLGFDPKMEITCIDGEMKIGSRLRQIIHLIISARFLPIIEVPVSIISLPLQAVLSDTFHMIISPTASRQSNVMWKIAKHLRMLI